MVRVRINTSQVNRAIRELNREVDKQVKREMQKLEQVKEKAKIKKPLFVLQNK